MKEEILSLRKLGMSLAEIAMRTGYSLTDVCQIVYDENSKDKHDSGR